MRVTFLSPMHQIIDQKIVREWRCELARLVLSAIFSCAIFFPSSRSLADQTALSLTLVPRVVVVLFDSRSENSAENTLARRFVESPLNHLGLIVRYVDVATASEPKTIFGPEVRGVVTAFQFGASPSNPDALLTVLATAMEERKKIVLLGDANFLFMRTISGRASSIAAKVLTYVGLRNLGKSTFLLPELESFVVDRTFVGKDAVVDPSLWSIPLAGPLFDTDRLIVGGRLTTEPQFPPIALVLVGDHGGVAFGPYAFSEYTGSGPAFERRSWYLDPHRFFSECFELRNTPRLDVSSAYGRRLFIALIDGAGLLAAATSDGILTGQTSAEVLRDRILDPNSDLLFTVAPVAAEIDEEWVGNPTSIRNARELLTRPNVRLASSGYSNVWNFQAFETESAEAPVVDEPSDDTRASLGDRGVATPIPAGVEPRQYSSRRFDLRTEVVDAQDKIRALASYEGRDAIPFVASEQALISRSLEELSFSEGIAAFIGGRSRLDPRFPSAAWLEPISSANEGEPVNHYVFPLAGERALTTVSGQPEYAYQFAEATLLNTESPIRLRPFALRFGMDLGQSTARRLSVEKLLSLARAQRLFSVSLSGLAAIEEGFFSTRILECGKNCWTLSNRGLISTVRFDSAGASIDYAQSSGVLGAIEYQNSLYVSLDPAVDSPVVVLNDSDVADEPAAYLVDSGCEIRGLERLPDSITFDASCSVNADMKWRLPWSDSAEVVLKGESGQPLQAIDRSDAGTVRFALARSVSPYRVEITKGGGQK